MFSCLPVGSVPIVQAILSCLRHVLAKPKSCKDPNTVDLLKATVESVGLADRGQVVGNVFDSICWIPEVR